MPVKTVQKEIEDEDVLSFDTYKKLIAIVSLNKEQIEARQNKDTFIKRIDFLNKNDQAGYQSIIK